MPPMGREQQLRPLISATNASNITIAGDNGTIDGAYSKYIVLSKTCNNVLLNDVVSNKLTVRAQATAGSHGQPLTGATLNVGCMATVNRLSSLGCRRRSSALLMF